MKQHLPGLWCPWAEVLCYDCHGPKIRDKTIPPDDWRACTTPREGGPNEGEGHCMKCNRAVWVRDDVAAMQRIQGECGGRLEQTGGMCCGLIIERADRNVVFVSALDGPIMAGLYPPDPEGEGWCDMEECLEFEERDEGDLGGAIEMVKRMATGGTV